VSKRPDESLKIETKLPFLWSRCRKMASVVSLTEEAKGKAVKTHIPVEEPPVYKVCPLLNSPCIKESCEWYAEECEACAIHIITVALTNIREMMSHE